MRHNGEERSSGEWRGDKSRTPSKEARAGHAVRRREGDERRRERNERGMKDDGSGMKRGVRAERREEKKK